MRYASCFLIGSPGSPFAGLALGAKHLPNMWVSAFSLINLITYRGLKVFEQYSLVHYNLMHNDLFISPQWFCSKWKLLEQIQQWNVFSHYLKHWGCVFHVKERLAYAFKLSNQNHCHINLKTTWNLITTRKIMHSLFLSYIYKKILGYFQPNLLLFKPISRSNINIFWVNS